MQLQFIEQSLKIHVFAGGRVTRADSARLLGVHPASCAKLEKRGQLTALRVGGKVFYALEEVKRLAGIKE